MPAQIIKRFGVAEKTGDVDQKIAEQQFRLARFFAQQLEIFDAVRGADHLHAALDAPQHGAALVLAEIMSELAAQLGAKLDEKVGDIG